MRATQIKSYKFQSISVSASELTQSVKAKKTEVMEISRCA